MTSSKQLKVSAGVARFLGISTGCTGRLLIFNRTGDRVAVNAADRSN